MDLGLKGRVALVTGGSKGIGAAIVRELATEGVHVCFCARASTAMESLEAEVNKSGGSCRSINLDVFDSRQITAAVENVASEHGQIDILVNNVGGALRYGSFMELTDDDWMKAYEFNVLSLVRFTRATLPHLLKSDLRRVINVSSISAIQPGTHNPHYTATKAAVVNISKHLANLLAKDQVLVNTVCPGPVHSESWDLHVLRTAASNGTSEAEARQIIEQQEAGKIPLGVVGEGREIAAAVAFLASARSPWTTGTCLHINGGKLAVAL